MLGTNVTVARLLSIGSTRVVDLSKRTTRRTSGVRPPTGREADNVRQRFEQLVPWPPVPGLPLTIVWSTIDGRSRMTRTSMVLAAWQDCGLDPGWRTDALAVSHEGRTVLTALTPEAAHGLAVVLASSAASCDDKGAPPHGWFEARGATLVAGADPLGTFAAEDHVADIVNRLCRHPAAQLLAPGIAVAADPSAGSYRLDPTWQMRDGPEPWAVRVAEAALRAGALISVDGGINRWEWTGMYRHVPCGAAWDGSRMTFDLDGAVAAIQADTLAGPLQAVSVLMDAVDGFGDAALLRRALDQH